MAGNQQIAQFAPMPTTDRINVFGFNDVRQAVGWSLRAEGGNWYDVFWSNPAAPGLGPRADGINPLNEHGQVATYTNNRAAVWHNGQFTLLGVNGGTASYGNGINNLGDVAGNIWHNSATRTEPFIIHNSSVSILDYPKGYLQGSADGVNDTGLIVGNLSDQETELDARGIIWAANTHEYTVIEPLAGYRSSWITGLSNSGVVVGVCTDRTSAAVPEFGGFIWVNGVASSLNSLVTNAPPDLSYRPRDINANGVIVGTLGYSGAFVLTPVPEADAKIAIATGAVLFYLLRRRPLEYFRFTAGGLKRKHFPQHLQPVIL
jgi:uncharacterized membrane protein